MYHSVYFITSGSEIVNTYTTFHLVPDGRPTIAPPAIKTDYIEVPGANGRLDMSESLTGYPTYNDREGSLSFIALNDYILGSADTWIRRYQNIMQYIHGQKLIMYLEDDPDYRYRGRFIVEGWESSNDGTYSKVKIKYTLDPYKYYKNPQSLLIDISSSSASYSINRTTGRLGIMPVVPSFRVTNVTNNLTISAKNPELYSGTRSHTVSQTGTYKFSDIVLTDRNATNANQNITIDGTGTVYIEYEIGDL